MPALRPPKPICSLSAPEHLGDSVESLPYRVRPKFIGGPVSIPAFGQRRVRNQPYPLPTFLGRTRPIPPIDRTDNPVYNGIAQQVPGEIEGCPLAPTAFLPRVA